MMRALTNIAIVLMLGAAIVWAVVTALLSTLIGYAMVRDWRAKRRRRSEWSGISGGTNTPAYGNTKWRNHDQQGRLRPQPTTEPQPHLPLARMRTASPARDVGL